MAAISHKTIFGIALFFKMLPTIVIEDNISSAYNTIEQMFKRGDLGRWRVEVDVQKRRYVQASQF